MFQRLPIALAHVKAGNTSDVLLSEIKLIVFSLYQAKEITKNVDSNIEFNIDIKLGQFVWISIMLRLLIFID